MKNILLTAAAIALGFFTLVIYWFGIFAIGAILFALFHEFCMRKGPKQGLVIFAVLSILLVLSVVNSTIRYGRQSPIGVLMSLGEIRVYPLAPSDKRYSKIDFKFTFNYESPIVYEQEKIIKEKIVERALNKSSFNPEALLSGRSGEIIFDFDNFQEAKDVYKYARRLDRRETWFGFFALQTWTLVLLWTWMICFMAFVTGLMEKSKQIH